MALSYLKMTSLLSVATASLLRENSSSSLAHSVCSGKFLVQNRKIDFSSQASFGSRLSFHSASFSSGRRQGLRNTYSRNIISGVVRAMAATQVLEVAVGGKSGVSVQVYPEIKSLSEGLAEYLEKISADTISKRKAFTLVLSGGSLVKALGALAGPEYIEKIDWTRWHIFWADERVVPLSSPDSNYKAAFEEFLSKVPIPTGQVYAINESLSPEGAADDYETNLKHLAKTGVLASNTDGTYPQFDVILLGMGPDGHIASLFPHHPLLQEKKKWVAHILDSPKPPPERITLTFPVINSAANIGFVALGASKKDQLKTLFGAPVPQGSLPAQDVYPKDGKLVWFIDEAAAEGVPK